MYRKPVDINRIIIEKGLSATAARLLDIINRLVCASANTGKRDRHGIPFCYASKDRLASMLGKSKRTAERALRELIDADMITSRRTTRNAHIYITFYGLDGASETDKNGGCNYSPVKNNNNYQVRMSFSPTYTGGRMTDSAPRIAENEGQPARISAARATAAQPQSAQGCKKGRPTPKRPTVDRAAREAARQMCRRHLEKRLNLDGAHWLIPEFEAEYLQAAQLVDIIADAVSANNPIRVNGCTLTAAQYWEAVKDLEYRDIDGKIGKLNEIDITRGIHNRRGYLLATIYNAVTVDRLLSMAG